MAPAAAEAAKWNREVCKVAGRRVGAAAEGREASLTIAAAAASSAATATATSTTVAAAIFDVCFDFRQRDKIFLHVAVLRSPAGVKSAQGGGVGGEESWEEEEKSLIKTNCRNGEA